MRNLSSNLIMVLAATLFIGALVAAEQPAGAETPPGPAASESIEAPQPAIDAAEARSLAEAYVREKKIDLSKQVIGSVTLHFDKARNQSFLHVQWQWRQPRMGGEFGLDIFMDKTVVERPCGP